MRYLTLIAILSLFAFGCVTTDQPSPSPQEAKQTSDTIGPLRAEPVNVNVPVTINPASGDLGEKPTAVGDVSINVTVTTSNAQQGSTEQQSDQGQTRGNNESNATNTPTVDTSIPVSLTP